MSEEKLYALKNDDGKYWDFDCAGFWRREISGCYATNSKIRAEIVADEQGGHVVTLIEEPEKVVLTKEQAEIVERAHTRTFPALFIAENGKNETLLMEAYVNGYTVAKEKRYSVKVPHTDDSYFYKVDDDLCNAGDSFSVNFNDDTSRFTEAEIKRYGLQDCERVESD